MKNNFLKHLITSGSNLKNALRLIEKLPEEGVLFVVTKKNILIGSLTDGDIRRAMIKNRISLNTTVDEIMERNPKFIIEDNYDLMEIMGLREKMYKVIPILSIENKIIDILNFNKTKTILPVNVVVMAGGEGKRLRPITNKIPKPMIPRQAQS